MTERTGGEAIVQGLLAHGVDTVFGIPGYQTYHLIDAIARAKPAIQLISPRHEQGAGYMAFGYARSTGRLGVCSVVPGPGVLNAASALVTAQSTATPLLCIVGEIPSFAIGKGMGLLHELPDQLGTLRTLTKHAVRIDRPADAPDMVAEAIHAAHSGRPGVAVIELATDVMPARDDVADAAGAPLPVVEQPIDGQDIRAAADLLAEARNPVIIAGIGAVHAADEVEALADRFQAPVVTYHNSRGVVTSRSPLSFSLPQGYAFWGDADLVIGIGSRLEFPFLHWGNWGQKKLLRIDINGAEIHRHGPPTLGIEGDSKAVLAALLAATTEGPVRQTEGLSFQSLKPVSMRTTQMCSPSLIIWR